MNKKYTVYMYISIHSLALHTMYMYVGYKWFFFTFTYMYMYDLLKNFCPIWGTKLFHMELKKIMELSTEITCTFYNV